MRLMDGKICKKPRKKCTFKYNKLLGKIKEIYGTQEEFAMALGIGRVSLSQRLNNQLDFSQSEVYRSIRLLGIPKDKVCLYFFQSNTEK